MPGTGPETGDRTATENVGSLPMKLTKESQYQCDIQLSLNLTLPTANRLYSSINGARQPINE